MLTRGYEPGTVLSQPSKQKEEDDGLATFQPRRAVQMRQRRWKRAVIRTGAKYRPIGCKGKVDVTAEDLA
jgi:hypothetical protein